MGIEAFVPESPVERFDEGIICWLAGAREVQLHAVFIGPAIQRLRDELGAIVHPNGTGRSAYGRYPCHRFDNLLALDPLGNVDRQCFTGESIDDGQRPKSSTVEQRVGTKSIAHRSLADVAAG